MPSCPASSRWHCWLSSKAAHWALFQAAASRSCQELWFFLTPFMEARSVIFPFPHFKPCCRGLAATSVGLPQVQGELQYLGCMHVGQILSCDKHGS